jgi:hypothetical protein
MLEEPTPADAVRALRARGVDTADELLAYGTPPQILSACERWDRRQGVGPGLLARWIRDGTFEEPDPEPPKRGKAAQLRERFDEYVRRFPVGAVAESHADLVRRRWPDDWERAKQRDEEVCPGDMIVVAASYPVLEMECDECGFSAGLTPRHLHVLPFGTPVEKDLGF